MRRMVVMVGLAALAGAVATPAGAQAIGGSAREQLLLAIARGKNSEVNDYVRENGAAALDYVGHSGESPLTTAIKARNPLFARFLLQGGANPDLANKEGETPLTLAVRLNDMETIEALDEYRVSVDKGNAYGETPLIVAVDLKRAALVRRLVAMGANPDLRDHRAGYSAREYAARETRDRSLLRIIEQGAKKAR